MFEPWILIPIDDDADAVPAYRLGMFPLAQLKGLTRSDLLTLVVFLMVMLDVVLELPGGVGPSHLLLLGSNDAPEMMAMKEAWERLWIVYLRAMDIQFVLLCALFFVLDTALFVPLYLMLLLGAARRVSSVTFVPWASTLGRVLMALSLLLACVDVLENASGLARLSVRVVDSSFGLLLAGAIATVVASLLAQRVWRVASGRPEDQPLRRGLTWTTVLATTFVLAHGCVLYPMLDIGRAVAWAKYVLAGSTALGFSAFALAWLFGVGADNNEPSNGGADRDSIAARVDHRAKLRKGFGNVLWRIRYVISALILFAALTLHSDQSRDVIVGLADSLYESLRRPMTWDALQRLTAGLIALVLTAAGVWALSFSCWLWTCLVCRIPRADARDRRSGADLGQAPQHLARALALVPPFIVALATAQAARDAAWADASESRTGAPLVLLLLGVACAMGAVWFWHRIKHRVSSESACYNDKSFDPAKASQALNDPHYRLFGLHATSLPVAALVVAVLTRVATVLLPIPLPFAFVVIVWSLVAWLGIFGWLSLKETRESKPWLILIIAVTTALSVLGLTQNHDVRLVQPGVDATLMSASAMSIATIVLTAVVVASALWIRYYPERWASTLGATFLAAWSVLFVTDRRDAAHEQTREAAAHEPRPTLAEFIDGWSATYRASTDKPNAVIVVAEGGGMRAAYWTARSLQQLTNRISGFDRQILALSGVSGGALGSSVYRACLDASRRHTSQEDQANVLDKCVGKFGDSDLLTPLVGAWLLEDALARFLPTFGLWPVRPCGLRFPVARLVVRERHRARGAWDERGSRPNGCRRAAALPELDMGRDRRPRDRLRRADRNGSRWLERFAGPAERSRPVDLRRRQAQRSRANDAVDR